MNVSATKKLTGLLTILVISSLATSQILNQSEGIYKIDTLVAKENFEEGLTLEQLFLNNQEILKKAKCIPFIKQLSFVATPAFFLDPSGYTDSDEKRKLYVYWLARANLPRFEKISEDVKKVQFPLDCFETDMNFSQDEV